MRLLPYHSLLIFRIRIIRMASSASKPSHLERTAAERRAKSLNTVVLKEVIQINPQIRLYRLELSAPLRFLPGQWLDVFVPGVAKAGGYTITSTPSAAHGSTASSSELSSGEKPLYLELAVQKSSDLPAAWLWQRPDDITYAELRVRVGGSFVWPPPGINVRALRKVVFVAGGVGVNPLVSMIGALAESRNRPSNVQFLYSVKDPGEPGRASRILFLERLAAIFGGGAVKGKLQLFLTGGNRDEDREEGVVSCGEGRAEVTCKSRRMTVDDVVEAVGGAAEKRFAVVYVCGVPTMTDDFVHELVNPKGLGMEHHRVLCEKWW
ncbi:NADH-cytochrome b-5 reductase [Xylariaceae sp. FL0662B]|nr:NADH-cytochrome b-5 reductase [Xylariaceae sp. FL0662B]